VFLTDAGKVSEGSAEHVFIVRDGVLYTPPSTEDNLDGITRRSLITLATEDLGILTVTERSIGRSELYTSRRDVPVWHRRGDHPGALASTDACVGDGGDRSADRASRPTSPTSSAAASSADRGSPPVWV
jgi:hypothetical protein